MTTIERGSETPGETGTPGRAPSRGDHARQRRVPAPPARPFSRHDLDWVAAGLRRAAQGVGVTLGIDYSRRVAADGLATAAELAVTPLGAGVVIHTRPASPKELPLVLGYADGAREWDRTGRRSSWVAEAAPAPEPSVGPSDPGLCP